MKTIGLIGGMSWESSAVYYKIINQEIKKCLGSSSSCKSIMLTVNFDEIAKLQHEENWGKLSEIMIDCAQKLEKAGADFVVLCTNTMHKLAPAIQANINIPFFHIADAIAQSIHEKGISKVGLLGTKFTMEQDFLKGKLNDENKIECLIPNEDERQIIHDVIYNELVKGIISEKSRNAYLKIIDRLISNGAQAIILGCTEIGLLITPEFTNHILFETTEIHAKAAVKMAVNN